MNHFVCSLPFLAEVNVRPKGMMVARPWDHSRSFGIPVVTVTKPSNSYVPEGTTVLIPTYGLQRNPRYFRPPRWYFVPERWLPTSKQLELEPAIFKDQSKVVQNLDASCHSLRPRKLCRQESSIDGDADGGVLNNAEVWHAVRGWISPEAMGGWYTWFFHNVEREVACCLNT